MSKIEYDVDQIKSLQNIDVIRQMPAMYLGNLNSTEQLLIEIISNSIDEFMAGHGNVIDVHIFKDCSVEITDRGRGIPVGLSKIFKDDNGNPIDTLTGILTTLHSGGKYSHMGDSGYKTATSGLHGCGACATNAVSDKFIATVKRNGHIYRQEFEKGIPITDVEIIGDTNETGTTIFYHPDKTIYKISLEPYGKMEQRLSELASLNSGLTINYINDKRKINKTFFFEDGIRGYTLQMIENRQKLYEDPFSIKGDFDNLDGSKINVDISFIHDDETEPSGKVKAFVNSVNTYEFGTHVLGFRQGYREIINEYAINKKLIKEPIEMRYLEDGLYVTISLKMTNAEFEGQTKTKLGNAIAKDAVVDVLKKGFEKIIKNKQLCKTIDLIVDRANKTKVAELAARQARANSRKAKNLNKMALPGKLADCANHDGQSELFIVEGDSAAGSTKAARWKEFQSVLPLRGKILNVSKADIGKILNSEIIKGIFAAVGGGVGKSFDINNIRYDKVIMMCFTGDTKVKMLDGTVKTLEELSQEEKEHPGQTYWIYSVDEKGKFVPGKAKNPRMIRETNDLVYITLDNDHIVKCTPDHKFMLRDGTWKEARNLNKNDSLMPIYTQIAKSNSCVENGREILYQNGKRKLTHRLVAEHYFEIDKHRNHAHHKDHNKLNNSPDNLLMMSKKEHSMHHFMNSKNKDLILNKNDDDSKKILLEAWNACNNDSKDWGVTFNKSYKHKQNVKRMNKDKNQINLQHRGKIIKSIATLIRLGKEITPEYIKFYAKHDLLMAPTLEMIEKRFESFEEMLNLAKKYEETMTENDFLKRLNIPKPKMNDMRRGSMAKFGKMALDEFGVLNETTYSIQRKKFPKTKSPKFDKYEKYFDTFEEFENFSRTYNHKIKNVEFKHFDIPIKTYCLNVDKYHNFGIDVSSKEELNKNEHSMVIVHNCDADVKFTIGVKHGNMLRKTL